ncbi:ATP-grasp domain-containing protein [Halomonas sp. MCCC 1A17488]|uniref:carboxylate--amine ligase n=1 Tax=unclassified Halomonas TaxID=2609666 RepID=UPI0018D272CB|nr:MULTISPECIES: ATP-grasp domain-containing protein [unclassified Halomonas]MCE8017067.1 ATP-grasp domain-containing protein [Halomonas sp. MCCC 1A17488]MCG3240400.1 ATP-grasp domain-containing protein [Halomonas sp. MCCC 1A17488]QPP49736.1 ATP-grasp domain-containing protein [Halomonas sp. SS10-MC5]
MGNETRVMLTHGWCRSSYSALRGLARRGVPVVVADTARVGMCQASRLTRGRGRYRSPYADPDGFVDDIAALCERHRIGLLLPGHEEGELLAQAREAGRLPAGVSLPLANVDSLVRVNDKDRISRLARDLDVPVAPIVDYRTPAEAGVRTDSTREYVARARRGNSSKGVRFARGGAALTAALERMVDDFALDPARLPIVQECVAGDGWGVSCLYWYGERIASFTHHRLQEKIATGGTSTLRVSAAHPSLEADAHRLLDALGWHGLAMLEFKFDPTSGRHVFIEINPRLWGSIDLALSAGVNFPWLLYLAETRGPAVARAHFRPGRSGVVSRWLLGDLLRRLDLLRRGRLRDGLGVDGTRAHAYDDFKLDDPLVLFGEALYYLAKGVTMHSLNPVEAGMVR